MAEIYLAAAAMVISRRRRATKPVEINIDEALTNIRTGDINDPEVFRNICLNLSSTIESAIMMKAVPSSSYLHQLLLIAKEVYNRRTKYLQPWLMLIMQPLKDASQVGWFLDGDKDDILMMENEIRYGFSNTDETSTEQSNAHSCVSNVVSRFYPTMKLENVLASIDVKAGSRTFLADFHISLDKLPTQYQNLFLLVSRVDSMDTSACIVKPSNVKFLINDYEVHIKDYKVPNLTKINMGKEPQLPSNVTKMMKDGVNRLQVCGNLDANSGEYIIAVAFMSSIPCPDPPQLQDYVHYVSVRDDSDCEIIEMPTQVSLNCPISQLRIKTPVKGHLCEHRQCFDYKYYMEINAIRPTWKCPICNKPVCNLDIRIDQDFLKILNEVAKGVNDVTISPDGSWLAGMPEKSIETRRRTKTQNNCVPDIDGNLISKEASVALPIPSLDSHNSDVSGVKVGAERPSTAPIMAAVSPPPLVPVVRDSRLQSQSSNVPGHNTPPLVKHNSGGLAVNVSAEYSTPVVSPQVFKDSGLQSQGSNDRVHNTPPSVKQTKDHLTKKARTTFTPIQLTLSPNSTNFTESIAERLKRRGEQRHFTPGPCRPTPVPARASAPASNTESTNAPLMRQGQQLHDTPAQSNPTPIPAPDSTPASKTGQLSPTLISEPSGEMPFGRMRGSLKGTELEAARLQCLQTQQPIRANEPWSIPIVTYPPELELLMRQQPSTTSDNVSN